MGKQNENSNPTSTRDVSELILSTLENRREQLATRSTVCLAAASGLLVLAVQFVFDVCKRDDYAKYTLVIIVLIACIIMCALAIMTSIDLIKLISRKKHMGRGQQHTDPNIYYFGWIAQQSEDTFYNYLNDLTNYKQNLLNIRQAISLSKNLDYRYKQLKKNYVIFLLSLSIYVLAIIMFVCIQYDVFTWIIQFFAFVIK